MQGESRITFEYTLYDGMNTEDKLYRVPKGSNVNFIRDVSLVGKPLKFFINFPEDPKKGFKRDAFIELEETNNTIGDCKADCFDNFFELSQIETSGSFHFQFSVHSDFVPNIKLEKVKDKLSGSGYLIVDPKFSGTKIDPTTNEKVLKEWDMSGVVMQTYLPKCLGHFPEWESRLTAAFEGNYNMIHFTPLQELGYSRSAYSLRNQLGVNPELTPPGSSKPIDWSDVKKFIQHLETDNSVLSMTDLVFNHTSNDSPWLHKHPECAYNVVNSPHLAPAYIFDHAVWRLSLEASDGSLAGVGIPKSLGANKDAEMDSIRHWLYQELEKAKLYEFFMADVQQTVDEFKKWIRSTPLPDATDSSGPEEVKLEVRGPRKGRRFGASVEFAAARRRFLPSNNDDPSAIEQAAGKLAAELECLNRAKESEVRSHLDAGVGNILANVDYRFYDNNGLKLGQISKRSPLMWRYFYHPVANLKTIEEAEQVLYSDDASRIMAFNGWVMSDNPLRDFAKPDSNVYLRRELVVWGDSCKLRYGDKPEDCPYLWKHMEDYVALTAEIFHAIRLDNCHSTPLHVGQHMLDHARSIRPNIYVVAELFTPSEAVDNIFINKLGINSLIRECLAYGDCKSLCAHLYKYGVARPAGAFIERGESRSLYPSFAHALLYDQTHDNESVIQKHSVKNALPLSALCAALCCAVGTTRGYDELVPHNIDVVQEERRYSKWPSEINNLTGLVQARSELNALHLWLTDEGFNETYIDQVTPDVLAITRICPRTCESVVTAVCTAFSHDLWGKVDEFQLELNGVINRLMFEMHTCVDGPESQFENFAKNSDFVNGANNVKVSLIENEEPGNSGLFTVSSFTNVHGILVDRLNFRGMSRGCVVVVSARLNQSQENALAKLHSSIDNQFTSQIPKRRRSSTVGLKAYAPIELPEVVPGGQLEPHVIRLLATKLDLIAVNRLLFRCDSEESAELDNYKPYTIPDMGSLCYAGLQSVVQLLTELRSKNDLGHPLCNHLRQGDWLANYLIHRLTLLPPNARKAIVPILGRLASVLAELYAPLHDLPRYLVPSWFEYLTTSLYNILYEESINLMARWIGRSSSLVKNLAIASIQFYGYLENCILPPPTQSPGLSLIDSRCSLAAGLPHFAEGMWRCWGRDTFISLPGCLLLTGRFKEAATSILSYASLLRHGLIPNLTGDGSLVKPRYNCRDSVWFWLYAIVCYEQALLDPKIAPSNIEGYSILGRSVARWFPDDDAEGWPPSAAAATASQTVQPLYDVMQEALQRHFDGIDFVERNAGSQLDEQMEMGGFRVTASIDHLTGFPQGGNKLNCGTWMDKMGSSAKAGNKGTPATPRDGSAVELVGLAYAVVSWLANRSRSVYPHAGVKKQSVGGPIWSWSEWASLIKASFEPAYWIPSDTRDPALVYNKGIYRDSVKSSAGFTDNQLRPNFLITMVVAPELFTMERAWNALELARLLLVGPLGMRTLAPNDLAYNGFYNNSDDSTTHRIAKGFNYHQGPEWLWPMGFYLRARLMVANRLASADPSNFTHLVDFATSECQSKLACLNKALKSSPWFSLPELTNANGEACHDSCAAQAWSVGCILEAVYDLHCADKSC